MDEEGVAGAVPEGLVLVGVGECVGVGEALDDGDDDPEAVGGGQHDEQFVEVPAMDPSRCTTRKPLSGKDAEFLVRQSGILFSQVIQ